jgi:deoxyribodipyrimidine photo-lyase
VIAPLLVWLRRDLRLHDHPALTEAAASGRPVIPLFIRDESVDALAAAPKWRLERALDSFSRRLEAIGSRLILRSGKASEVLRAVVAETGADTVLWSRCYDAGSVARDGAVKDWAKADGLTAHSFNSHLLHEPWEIATKQGTPFKVYTPFWRTVAARDVPAPLPAVKQLSAPSAWPSSDRLDAWKLGAAMRRGGEVVAEHAVVGEEAALGRLATFLDGPIETYATGRDLLAEPATSGLSENLTWGEISPRTVWHHALEAGRAGARGAERFRMELVWRDFAWHLFFHAPEMGARNWRREWDAFPWRSDNEDAERWRRGMTGEPVVDAAMRQMYVTGTMHNRARMIVASYLTKHLLTDWRVGLAWFEECLIDWDPASNALGWQWVAGSGPDAAPYFRVFNPATQADRFDPDGAYRRAWIAEGQARPPKAALAYFRAVPKRWHLKPEAAYPPPVVELAEGRDRALAAYQRYNG